MEHIDGEAYKPRWVCVIQQSVVLPAVVRVDVWPIGKELHRYVALEVWGTAINAGDWESLLGWVLALGFGPVLVRDRS